MNIHAGINGERADAIRQRLHGQAATANHLAYLLHVDTDLLNRHGQVETVQAILREMERNGLVMRQVFPQVPPKVEYFLTALGASLRPVVEAMCRWGEAHGVRPEAREAIL